MLLPVASTSPLPKFVICAVLVLTVPDTDTDPSFVIAAFTVMDAVDVTFRLAPSWIVMDSETTSFDVFDRVRLPSTVMLLSLRVSVPLVISKSPMMTSSVAALICASTDSALIDPSILMDPGVKVSPAAPAVAFRVTDKSPYETVPSNVASLVISNG